MATWNGVFFETFQTIKKQNGFDDYNAVHFLDRGICCSAYFAYYIDETGSMLDRYEDKKLPSSLAFRLFPDMSKNKYRDADHLMFFERELTPLEREVEPNSLQKGKGRIKFTQYDYLGQELQIGDICIYTTVSSGLQRCITVVTAINKKTIKLACAQGCIHGKRCFKILPEQYQLLTSETCRDILHQLTRAQIPPNKNFTEECLRRRKKGIHRG